MNDSEKSIPLNRRNFLKSGGAAALVGVGATAAVVLNQRARFTRSTRPAVNPFAYDVASLRQTDPALLHFTQVGHVRSPHPEPRRLAIGPDDLVYVAAGNYVSVLDREGNSVSEIALSAAVRCLGVAADGIVFVGLRDHLESFDRKGQRMGTWEVPAGQPFFTGLAVGSSEVFVADAGNRLVLRYDRTGKLAGQIGTKNAEHNVPGFIVPSPFFDVDLAPDGLLRVSNPGRHRVEAYTTKGDFEFAWGKPSAAIDGFCGCCNPINLAMLPDGRCITCEKGLPRVKVYSPDGTFESVVNGPESFLENAKACSGEGADCHQGGLDAAVDSAGRVYVLDLVAQDIRIMARKPGFEPGKV